MFIATQCLMAKNLETSPKVSNQRLNKSVGGAFTYGIRFTPTNEQIIAAHGAWEDLANTR